MIQCLNPEDYAEGKPDLLICCDLANEKKHATLRRKKGRSGLAPQLGILSKGEPMYGAVAFDTRKNGMVEFAYSGKTRAHRFWVTQVVGIPFRTEILIARKRGVGSKGDAVEFIFNAFKQCQPLMKRLGISPRSEYIERARVPCVQEVQHAPYRRRHASVRCRTPEWRRGFGLGATVTVGADSAAD